MLAAVVLYAGANLVFTAAPAIAHVDSGRWSRWGAVTGSVVEERPDLRVRVVDDGIGFDPSSVLQGNGRHGIVSMRERAEEIGGHLEVHSRPGDGTEIVVVVP